MRRLLALGLLLTVITSLRADEEVKLSPAGKKSIAAALKYLKGKQKADGSWGKNSAITAFVVLAYMSDGNLPHQGIYASEVSKGIRNLVLSRRTDGFLAGARNDFGGNMYSHGMATLALTQAYGTKSDEELKKAVKMAVELIIKSQNKEGGWRYLPESQDADISVTIMQVMALRGAKDSGLHVPDETLRRATAYIERCRNPDDGGYSYIAAAKGSGYARTAAGVCVLQLAGDYDADQVKKGIAYLDKHREHDRQTGHLWYGRYYAAHAYHQMGGKIWSTYYNHLSEELIRTQKPTGEWHSPEEAAFGSEYQTAIAVLALNIPADYLPIFQR